MKKFVQLLLAFLSLIAGYVFVYHVLFSLFTIPDGYRPVKGILSFLLAASIAVFTWKKLENLREGQAHAIFSGGFIVGSVSFLVGFLGPMILNPTSGQGPLLGIFITGPLGFIIGLVGGGIYWKIRTGKDSSTSGKGTID